VVVQPVGVSETFLVTNVYDPQRIDDKLKLLESLIDLRKRQAGIPCIMGGDFNMIKSLSGKKRRYQSAKQRLLSVPIIHR